MIKIFSSHKLVVEKTKTESPVAKRSTKTLPHYKRLKNEVTTLDFLIKLHSEGIQQAQNTYSVVVKLNLIFHHKQFDDTHQSLIAFAPSLLPRSADLISVG